MGSAPDVLLDAVTEVARLTGDVALRHYRTTLAIETKADGSPVSAADRAAEAAAREWIALRFPRDGILGEELGDVRPDAARRWILDPIDGTRTFIHGVPLWGSLVAVIEGESIVAGAACFPAVNETVSAAPGAGCWWNGARCFVSAVSSIAEATVLTTDERFAGDARQRAAWERLSGRALVSRSWGDCYGYLLVATGRAEVMIDGRMNAWDAAPFLPILEEAGGVLTDWNGARTAFGGSTVATNRALAAAARSLMRDATAVGGVEMKHV